MREQSLVKDHNSNNVSDVNDQEVSIMSPGAVLSETEVVVTNQMTILRNQTLILKNQEEIKKNQETLNVIVKNQEKILAALRH